jgi:hypothetical protein
MKDRPARPAEDAAEAHVPELQIWRACRREDGDQICVIFVDDHSDLAPSNPWIRGHLQRHYKVERRSAPEKISNLMRGPSLLVHLREEDLDRLIKELRLTEATIAALAYRSSECAVTWLEEVSFGGIEEYDGTEDIDAILKHLDGFLSGMAALTTHGLDPDSVEAEWESDRARFYLEPLLGRINARWGDFSVADFSADLNTIRGGLRNTVRGRPTSANLSLAAAATCFIRAWESHFGTVAGRGTSKKAPFHVLKRILASTEIIHPIQRDETTFTGFPRDELRTLIDELFSGDPPAFLRALDANYKQTTKQIQGKMAP